jgi:uncharacterized metal-binding protein YceD (DUF177 family)
MKPLLGRTIEIGAIGESGRVEHLEASPSERRAIAADLELVALDSLAGDLEVDRGAGGLIVVDGRVRAEVVQTCVVSLVPVRQTIDEPVHMTFVSAGSRVAPPSPKPGEEVMVDPDTDEPEPLAGSSIDLGAIVLEHFTLALDPYPRAPGAELPAEAAADKETVADSPFAALAKLAGRER